MATGTANLDIGNFSKRTILTGAGWTRNWGGRLAAELWQDLIGHRAIQENSRLRDLLLSELSFETALGLVQTEPFTSADRQTFEKGLLDAFIAMDREVARHDHDPWINIYKVQELLFRFCGRRAQGINAGYMFTLNQDVWPERYLYNEHASGALHASLPALRWRQNQRLFTTGIGPYSGEFIMDPVPEPAAQVLHGQFNVIKLHGSFNWRTADARGALVVGTEKSSQIAVSPLLTWYFDIFRKVVSAGDVRLMAVGYGFGDEHLNAAIADAIDHHGLKLFIWDTASNLRERILAAPCGNSLWKGLLSTVTRPMIEVFPSNQAETQDYRRIEETFFG